jgi:dienelactone hydrolase
VTKQTRFFGFFALLASCALGACDVEGDEFAENLDADAEFRVKTADPSYSTVHDVCPTSSTFNNVDALIRYPEGTSCWLTLADRPLVVVLPGAGFDYTEYAYLLDHLAANGFVAMSMDILADETPPPGQDGHQNAATTLVGALDDMLADWPFAGQIDPTNIALVGHSRGGLTVRYLADELAGPGDDWTVRAIVTLAGKISSEHPIIGNETEALLVLQGGDDADQPPARGFTNYDGADAEMVLYDAVTIDKSMKLLEDGVHYQFSTKYGLSTQAQVAKGYVLAFLAQHLLQDDFWYEDYIRGDDEPFGWIARVASQFRDNSRLVVDNFEDGTRSNPNIGGGVSMMLGTAATVIDLGDEDNVQHETKALQLGGVANGEFAWTFAGHDVTDHEWLSLRVGYLDDNGARSLSVRLRSGGAWSAPVLLSSHGTIHQPWEMCEEAGSALPCDTFDVYAHMGTIRVPLSAFGVGLGSVDGVGLVMGSKYATTTFVLDSIEFAGSP